MTISPLYDSTGKQLSQMVAGESKEAYFTVKSNANSQSLTIGEIKLSGLSGIYVGESQQNSCFQKTLSPHQQVRCDVVLTAGSSLPDTTSDHVRIVIRLIDKVNYSASAPMNFSVSAAQGGDALEIEVKTPFQEIYRQDDDDALVSGAAGYVLKNIGTVPISVNSIAFTKNQEFSLSGSSCTGVSLAPGVGEDSQCTFSADFATYSPGKYSDNLVVDAKQGTNPVEVTLPQQIQVFNPEDANLQLIPVQPLEALIMNRLPVSETGTYRVKNIGQETLAISAVDVATHGGRFTVEDLYSCKSVLHPGDSCPITLNFTTFLGDDFGIYENSLRASTSSSSVPADVLPSFSVTVSAALASWEMDNERVALTLAIPYDKPQISSTLSTVVSNTGLADIHIPQSDGIRFTSGQEYYAVINHDCGFVLSVGRSCTVNYRVVATDEVISKSPLVGQLEVSGTASGQALTPAVQTISTTVEKNVAPKADFEWVEKKPLPGFVMLNAKGNASAVGEYQLINQGDQPVTVTSTRLPTPHFSLYAKNSTCIGATLQPQDSCSVFILFITQGVSTPTQYSDGLSITYSINGEVGTEPVAHFNIWAIKEAPTLNVGPGDRNRGLPSVFSYRKVGNYITGGYKVTNTGGLDISNIVHSVGPKPIIDDDQPSGEVPACSDIHTLKTGASCLISVRFTPDCGDASSCDATALIKVSGETSLKPVEQDLRVRLHAINAVAAVGKLTIKSLLPFEENMDLGFGSASAEYLITNDWDSGGKATLGNINVTDPHFTLVDSHHCSGKQLGYQESCSITVRFSTDQYGRYLNQMIVPIKWNETSLDSSSTLMKISVWK